MLVIQKEKNHTEDTKSQISMSEYFFNLKYVAKILSQIFMDSFSRFPN